MIEEFFKAHQYTIQAIAAAGALAAVVVSLALASSARRADRTRLEAVANLMTIFHPTIDPKTAPEFLTVSITNHGKWPLRIPTNFFYWKARRSSAGLC
jgi:exosortase/archaeosortase